MMGTDRRGGKKRGRFGRILRECEGATVIEFAILAPIFFGIVFAIIETFVAYVAEQELLHANDAIARQIRMGEITFNTGRATDVNKAKFRELFCEEFIVLLRCSPTEPAMPSKLHINVYNAANYSDIDTGIPGTLPDNFTPGGKSAVNVVQSYYTWPIIVDYLRVMSVLHGSTSEALTQQTLVATAIFQNEEFK